MKRIDETKGMTEGNIFSLLVSFALPIILGTLFQTLYNTMDAIIVGRFLGKEALAAVSGGTSTMTNLIIGFFTGVSGGATVLISQFFGAGDKEKVHSSLHTASALTIVSGLIVTVLGLLFSSPLLTLIDTPLEIFDLASSYVKIFFLGSLPLIIYNMGSGILRALGDSKRPLYFLIVSCALNIALDLLFIAVLKTGVEGAATATVISQIVAAVMVVINLLRRNDSCKLIPKYALKADKFLLKKMMVIGLPGGIQSVMYSVSNLIIQTGVNHFGTNTAAAWGAYSKLDALFWMIIQAFGLSITTFVGQNYGAGKIKRAKSGTKDALILTLVFAATLTVLYLTCGQWGFMMFVSDNAVIEIGMRILRTIAPFFIIYIPIEILSGALRGVGKTVAATLFSVFGICGVRMAWLSIPWCTKTIERVMLSYAVSWTLVALLFIFYYAFSDVYSEKSQKSSL